MMETEKEHQRVQKILLERPEEEILKDALEQAVGDLRWHEKTRSERGRAKQWKPSSKEAWNAFNTHKSNG